MAGELFRADVRGLTVSRVQGHGGELERVETYLEGVKTLAANFVQIAFYEFHTTFLPSG